MKYALADSLTKARDRWFVGISHLEDAEGVASSETLASKLNDITERAVELLKEVEELERLIKS